MSGIKEMETDLDWTWYTSGMIVHKNVVRMATIQLSLLVMDARAWALSQATQYEQAAKATTTKNARTVLEKMASDLRRWEAGNGEITEDQHSLWRCSLPIRLRSEIGFLSVNEQNFEGYMEQVMSKVLPHKFFVPTTFVFVADPCQPELYALPKSKHFLDHASAGVYKKLLTEEELSFLLDVVPKDFPSWRSHHFFAG